MSLAVQRFAVLSGWILQQLENMRKSQVPLKEIAGNAEKYESYREAWSRIKLAQENHFFLEAITIQESIISDRLISFLSRSTAPHPLSFLESGKFPSFYRLIQYWRLEFPKALQSGLYPDLIEAVDQWRCMRNKAIHAIVKSESGKPTKSIDEFLQKAKDTAEEGEKLAREVCKWSQKEKRKSSPITPV